MTTTTTFDLARLGRAIEERDVAAQLACYDENAQITLVDRDNPPSSPRDLKGRDQIRVWLEDLCGRDMTHHVENQVFDGNLAAYNVSCRYPDGTRVLCATTLQLAGGMIQRQIGVQAWDA